MCGVAGRFSTSTGVDPHVLPDERLELIRRNFPQPLEPRDLRRRDRLERRHPLRFVVAVDSFLLVAHPEERRFQDVDVAARDQVREKPQEKRDEQIADVQAVHVGVGRQDDFLVAQALDAFLDVQARIRL